MSTFASALLQVAMTLLLTVQNNPQVSDAQQQEAIQVATRAIAAANEVLVQTGGGGGSGGGDIVQITNPTVVTAPTPILAGVRGFSITPDSLTNGVVGKEYTAVISYGQAVTPSTNIWSATFSSLPPGMSLAEDNGSAVGASGLTITNLPPTTANSGSFKLVGPLTQAGIFSFTVTFSRTDGGGAVGQKTYYLTIRDSSTVPPACNFVVAPSCPNGGRVIFPDPNSCNYACPTSTSTQASALTVLSPNGGEVWQSGSTQYIRWQAPSTTRFVKIQLAAESECGSGLACPTYVIKKTIAEQVANTGSYTWVVPQPDELAGRWNNHYFIVVTDVNTWQMTDNSNRPFTIQATTAQSLTINSVIPSRGGAGTVVTVYGTGLGDASSIEFYNSDGTLSGNLFPSSHSPNQVTFTINSIFAANSVAGTYQIRIVSNACPGGCSSNSLPFVLQGSVASPTVQVISPNGGEVWPLGSTQIIRWTPFSPYPIPADGSSSASVSAAPLVISLVDADGQSNERQIGSVSRSQTLYSWTIPNCTAANTCSSNFQIVPGQYKIRVSGPAASDVSDQPFTIVSASPTNLPDLQITDISPTSAEQNKTIEYTATVKNNSNYDVTAPFAVNLGGTATTISALRAGQTTTVKASFGLTILGANQVCARADIWNAVAESNESNNDLCQTVNVSATATQTPVISSLSPTSGSKVGDQVTIYGSGFTATGNTINAGNASIIVNSLDGKTLQFTVPSSLSPCDSSGLCGAPSTSWQVSVTNANGTSNSIILQVYAPSVISTPTITSLNPTSGPAGTQVTITGAGFMAQGNYVTFGGSAIAGLPSADGKTIIFTVPAVNPGVVHVSVWTNFGQSQAADFTVISGVTTVIAVNVTKNSAVPDQTATAGSASVKIGSYTLSAPATEGVRLTSLAVQTGATGNGLQNLVLKMNGTQIGAIQPTVNANSAYTFSGWINIPAGSTQVIDVYADVFASASGTMTPATTFTGCGGNGITSQMMVACSTIAGQVLTVNSANALQVVYPYTLPIVFETPVNTWASQGLRLQNNSGTSLAWTVTTPNWILLSDDATNATVTSGIIPAGASKAFTVTAEGDKVGAGTYSGSLLFSGNFSKLSVGVKLTTTAPAIQTPVITNLNPTSGPAGTQVTITGTGFMAQGNYVNFGGSGIAGLASTDGKTITFAVPSSANPGVVSQVYVLTNYGQSQSASFTVTTGTNTTAPLVVTKNSVVLDQTVTAGSANVKIGSYTLTASAASTVNLSYLTIKVGANANALQNLVVKVGGVAMNYTVPGVFANMSYWFSGLITIPAGGSQTVDVYADVLSTATGTISPATTLTSCGGSTQINWSPVSCSSVAGQGLTIAGTGTLTASVNTTVPPAAQITMGSIGVTLGQFRFTTDNSEDVKLQSLVITALSKTGSAAPIAFRNLQIYDGSTLVGTGTALQGFAGTATSIFNFPTPLVIPKNTTKEYILKGDVVSYVDAMNAPGNSYVFEIASASNITAYGVSSGMVVGVNAAAGQPFPIAANPQTVYRTKLSAATATLGSTANRVRNASDDVGTLTLTADYAYGAEFKAVNLTLSGPVLSASNGFTVALIDGDTGITVTTATVLTSQGTTVTSAALNLSTPYLVAAGQSKTFKIRVNSSGFANNAGTSDSLSVQIASASALTWQTQGSTESLGLNAKDVPITFSVAYE